MDLSSAKFHACNSIMVYIMIQISDHYFITGMPTSLDANDWLLFNTLTRLTLNTNWFNFVYCSILHIICEFKRPVNYLICWYMSEMWQVHRRRVVVQVRYRRVWSSSRWISATSSRSRNATQHRIRLFSLLCSICRSGWNGDNHGTTKLLCSSVHMSLTSSHCHRL